LQGNFEQAQQELRRASELYETLNKGPNAQASYYWADLQFRQGDYGEARKCLVTLFQSNPPSEWQDRAASLMKDIQNAVGQT
jgi:tetratricopeptide (TPR) repeat protein